MKGRRILATIDVYLVQVSDENAEPDAAEIVQEWCDQVFTESLWVQDTDSSDYGAKFDVNQTVIVRVVDSEEEAAEEIDVDEAVVLDGG